VEGLPYASTDFVLEGGSTHVDGEGSVTRHTIRTVLLLPLLLLLLNPFAVAPLLSVPVRLCGAGGAAAAHALCLACVGAQTLRSCLWSRHTATVHAAGPTQ
jgi:hypothetical protein